MRNQNSFWHPKKNQNHFGSNINEDIVKISNPVNPKELNKERNQREPLMCIKKAKIFQTMQ